VAVTAAAKKVFDDALALSDSEREELVEVLSRTPLQKLNRRIRRFSP